MEINQRSEKEIHTEKNHNIQSAKSGKLYLYIYRKNINKYRD